MHKNKATHCTVECEIALFLSHSLLISPFVAAKVKARAVIEHAVEAAAAVDT